MGQSWNDYEKAAEHGPLKLAIKIVCGCAILGGLITGIGYGFSVCGETAQIAHDEIGPRALLQKYTWLKEAHAQLEKKRSDIGVYQSRLDALTDAYKGEPRSKWARDDREQYSVWSSEVAGVKASYNDLAATYNAKMAEVNWRFANVGELPQGATEPLPREYAPYLDK